MSSIFKDDVQALLNCPICLDTFTEPKLLSCAHRFCKECLLREIERSATSGPNPSFLCPLCKRSISLPRRRARSQWIDHFETDCLLNGILQRIGCKQDVQGAPFKSVDQDDLEVFLRCSICLDTLNDPKLLPCAHRFCKTCLLRDVDRSTSSEANFRFPCPICKRIISISNGRPRKEWIDQFETDRLLKEIVEKVANESTYFIYGCAPHKQKIYYVCYSCGVGGCGKCVQKNHRHCVRIENFKTEAERIELQLRQNLWKIPAFIQKVNSYVKKWTMAEKSFHKQELESNRFVDQFIQHKRDQYKLRYSHLTEVSDRYIREKTWGKTKNDIQTLMKRFLETLDIDLKFKAKEMHLKKINRSIMLSDPVSTASEQLANAPDTSQLTNTMQDISRILALDLIEMVFQGQQLLTENKEVLSDEYQSHIVESFTEPPKRYKLPGLITKDKQVKLPFADEQKLLDRLTTMIVTREDPQHLMYDLWTLYYSTNKCNDHVLRVIPVEFESILRNRAPSNSPKLGALLVRDTRIVGVLVIATKREDRSMQYVVGGYIFIMLCALCLYFTEY